MVDILEVSQKRVDIVVTISYNMTMQLVLVKEENLKNGKCND